MRIRVSDPAFTDELVEHLAAYGDTVVDKIAEDELEVSLLGSRDVSMMQMEVYLRIRAWEAAPERAGVGAEVVPPVEPV